MRNTLIGQVRLFYHNKNIYSIMYNTKIYIIESLYIFTCTNCDINMYNIILNRPYLSKYYLKYLKLLENCTYKISEHFFLNTS